MIPRFRPPHTVRDLGVLFTRKKAGDSIAEFETSFAEVAGQSYARAFPYGRTALVAVLEYLKEHSDPTKSEVICPSYTCVVVAHAIVEAGLQPVFVDCDEETLNMDWEFVHQAVSQKTLAVISTSLFGNPVKKTDTDEFRAKFPSVPVIQDCAHSFFAGNAHREGIVAIYGMNVSKLMTTVFGGVASTNDSDLANWLREYQQTRLSAPPPGRRIWRSIYFVGSLLAFAQPLYLLTYWLQKMGILARFVDYYKTDVVDFPVDAYQQIGALEANLGLRQLRSYAADIERRQTVAKIYENAFEGLVQTELLRFSPGSTYSHFPLLVKNGAVMRRSLALKFVELGAVIEYDVSSMPSYQSSKLFGRGTSLKIPDKIVNLPVHRGIRTRDALRIAGQVRAHLLNPELDLKLVPELGR